jgi:hypothetical protein
MFFFFGEEMNNGHETLEQIKEWIERSRPYRSVLAQAGVAVSLNPWHSLLHADRGRTLKPGQHWQTMVDQHGRAGQATICPLDPDWQRYYEETLRLYAQEGFRVIWIDDDIRYHNHAPLDWGGCFCPLHVAEFNRRTGVNAKREDIVARCISPGVPHPWRAAWMDMWQETLLALITRWRAIVESGGARLGLMSSTPEAHAAEGRRWRDWWTAFAGDRPPIHRPHFWGYGDTSGANLPTSIALLDQNRAVQPERLENGPEIECFPYGAWNKSFRQTAAQMALAQIMGATNLNISLYDFMGNDVGDEQGREAFLRGWRPTLDWLADEFPMSLQSSGVGIPWSEDMGRTIHTNDNKGSVGGWQSLACPSRGWASWLAACGHAFTMRPAPVINALAGPVVWSFGDDQLRDWLSGSVLLDGVAAGILVERGLGELIGLQDARTISQHDVLYAVEQTLDADFGLRAGAQMSLNAHPYAEYLTQGALLPGVRSASDLRGPRQNVVGHGLLLFENARGGRVAIVPWDANKPVQVNAQRDAQLRKTLAYLARGRACGAVQGGAWLVPQFLAEGVHRRGVIWNASPDAVEDMTVHAPWPMSALQSAIHINARGERRQATAHGQHIHFAMPMQQWEFVVLRW